MPSFPAELPAEWIAHGLLDPSTVNLCEEILRRSAKAIGAENTALWLASDEALTPVLGTGTHAGDFIGSFEQPLTEGLISLVYASRQSLCDNAIENNPQHSSLLDTQLGIRTQAMIALPVSALGRTVGVITCVHTEAEKTFTTGNLAEFEFASACLSRFLDAALLLASSG